MNTRIKEIAWSIGIDGKNSHGHIETDWGQLEKFAELIIKECVETLEFHGFDEAVPYVKWMAANKMGIKE